MDNIERRGLILKGKRILAICIGVGLMIVTSLTGCTSQEPTKGEAHSKKKHRIRYANWEVYPAQLKLHQEVVDRFKEKHPDIEVDFEIVHGGPQKILIEIGGGMAPDVFYWCDAILPPLVEKGAVIDLMPFVKEDPEVDLKLYFPRVIEGLTYNGGLYGLPIYFGINALLYNKALFDKEGVPYPDNNWTWEDFKEAALKLTKRDNNGRVLQYGALLPDFHLVIKSFGGNFFNKEVNRCILDSPQTKDALQFLLDLQDKYKVVPSMAELEGEDKIKSGLQMFMAGKMGMFIAPSFLLATLDEIKSFSWDVAPIPVRGSYPRVSTFSTGNVCISSQCKDKRAAWEFAKYIASKEGTAIFGKGRNCVPPIKEVAYATFVSPPPDNIQVYVEAIDYAAPIWKVSWEDEFGTLVIRLEMDLLFLRQQSIEETIKKITKKAKEYISK